MRVRCIEVGDWQVTIERDMPGWTVLAHNLETGESRWTCIEHYPPLDVLRRIAREISAPEWVVR